MGLQILFNRTKPVFHFELSCALGRNHMITYFTTKSDNTFSHYPKITLLYCQSGHINCYNLLPIQHNLKETADTAAAMQVMAASPT